MSGTDLPDGYDSGSFEFATSLGVLTRRVVRRDAAGPTVILLHEAGGLSPSTLDVAAVLAGEGYRIVMPVLTDAPWTWGKRSHVIANMVRICVSRELAALSLGQTGAIVEWLRALADLEHNTTKRPVAVIGMCMTGGFALGTVTCPGVKAAVMSQPSLPFVLRIGRSDLGLSPSDLDDVKASVGTGSCIRAMRFSRDRISPPSRLKLIQKTFPDAECRPVETTNPKHHSVLALAVRPDAWPDLRLALDETLAFLARHLS